MSVVLQFIYISTWAIRSCFFLCLIFFFSFLILDVLNIRMWLPVLCRFSVLCRICCCYLYVFYFFDKLSYFLLTMYSFSHWSLFLLAYCLMIGSSFLFFLFCFFIAWNQKNLCSVFKFVEGFCECQSIPLTLA